jgi:hypothetical protein
MIALIIVGCTTNNTVTPAQEFKEEYESLNGVKNSRGVEHRTISISEDNPYIKVQPDEIVKMMDEKETFYLYVGDGLCPWCRSVLEKSIEMAKKYHVEKIYYVEIWDDEGTEIFRDKYELKDGEVVKTIDGEKSYHTLLKRFDTLLSDYTLTNENNEKVEVGEKRIYAPNFFKIEKGKATKMIEGYSDSLTDPRGELTEEILKDEEEQFTKLFSNENVCTAEGC